MAHWSTRSIPACVLCGVWTRTRNRHSASAITAEPSITFRSLVPRISGRRIRARLASAKSAPSSKPAAQARADLQPPARATAHGRLARALDPSFSPGLDIGNVNGSWINFPWDGWIDEIALYNRALSDAEVLAVFNAGQNGKCVTNSPPPAAVYDVSEDF